MDKKKYLKEIKDFIDSVRKDFKIQKVIFFGSRTNGESRKDSDIDLIIVSEDFNRLNFFERGAKMYDYWDINVPVDFICLTPEEYKKLKNKISIVSEALNTGITI